MAAQADLALAEGPLLQSCVTLQDRHSPEQGLAAHPAPHAGAINYCSAEFLGDVLPAAEVLGADPRAVTPLQQFLERRRICSLSAETLGDLKTLEDVCSN